MDKYRKKIKEISSARNKSSTASKSRGIKWTKNQQTRMRLLASSKVMTTYENLKSLYPTMSDIKLQAMLVKIKFYRKKLAEELNLSDVDGLRSSSGKGHIYLVENESYIGWIKCGMTSSINKRLNSYNSNDPLKRFRLIIEKVVENRRAAEKNLINFLKENSEISNGEWFRIDKETALELFKKI